MSDRRDLRVDIDDQQDVLEIVRASRVFARLAATLSIVARAADSSLCAGAARTAYAHWSAAVPQDRVRAIGLTLLSASLVSVVVNAVFGDTAGWFWLGIPFTAALAGVILVVASFRHHAREQTL